MEFTDNARAVAVEARRISTGDAGLDRVLGGGLFRGAVTILHGTPGAGKTTLANQMAFENSRRGGSTVYITLLSESHGRMVASLTPMAFFNEAEIGQSIHYISGYNALVGEGTQALLRLVAAEARSRQANLVVLDGLFVLADTGMTECAYRAFVNDLALQAELMGCTVLLLTNTRRASDSPEYTMVDAWLELGQERHDDRTSRFVEVHKLRGSGFLGGRHRLGISQAGVGVLPRLESHLGHAPPAGAGGARLTTGVPALDAMLHGGLPAASSTLVWGATGIGKTTLGHHFLAAASPAGPALLCTFYESPEECLRLSGQRGIDLASRVKDGSLHILWYPPIEHDIDEVAHAILDHVRAHGTKRLVIDALDAFEKIAVEPARLNRFLSALTNELRGMGCTSVFISEVPHVFGNEPVVLAGNRSAIGQNILLLRYTQAQAQLRRMIAVLKLRESGFDTRARAFEITGDGIAVGETCDPRSPPVMPASTACGE